VTNPLAQISVLPLAKLNKGSYTHRLYDVLRKEFGIEVIGLSSKLSMSRLLSAIGKRPIIHLHWIEHKYTLGIVNRLGNFSRFFIFFTIPFFILFLFTLKSLRFPIVTTLHNEFPHRSLLPTLERATFKIVLQLSRIVYVHTDYTKSRAKKLFGIDDEKIRKIDHGNWIHLFKTRRTYAEARKRLGIEPETLVLCFIGRISPDKGLHLLIESLKLVDSDSPIFLIVAGSPSNREYLETVINCSYQLPQSVRVKWYPQRISDRFLELLVTACDIGVLPYIKTSTPSAILLFMSFAKPLIAPRLPPVKEFVGNNYPFLYNLSAKGLRMVIQKAVTERNLLPKMGKKMLKRARRFDWNQTAALTYKDYQELYERL
jgi:glycosyltransferase involved in cell wall biosynthesis